MKKGLELFCDCSVALDSLRRRTMDALRDIKMTKKMHRSIKSPSGFKARTWQQFVATKLKGKVNSTKVILIVCLSRCEQILCEHDSRPLAQQITKSIGIFIERFSFLGR